MSLLESSPRPRPDDHGLAAFRAAVEASVVPLDVHADAPGEFRGRIHAVTSSDIHAIRVVAQQHSVTRTPQWISGDSERFVKFSLVESGTVVLVQDGRDCVLRGGDMAIYDTERPYSLVCDGDVEMSVLMLPVTRLGLPPELLRVATATRLVAGGPAASIVRPLIGSLGRASEQNELLATRMIRGAVEIVGSLVEQNLPARTPNDSMHLRILAYLDAHLTDPELSPSRIAAAHFISLRHLHFLFAQTGTSVSRVIRDRRLERCYDTLRDDASAHLAVSAIAYTNGFTDAAHFSRAFRAHFGFPPSAARPSAVDR